MKTYFIERKEQCSIIIFDYELKLMRSLPQSRTATYFFSNFKLAMLSLEACSWSWTDISVWFFPRLGKLMVKIEFSVKKRRPISDPRGVVKIDIATHTDYGHMMAKSLILCGPNSNSNPNSNLGFGCKT